MSLFDTTFRKQITEYLPPVIRGESLVDYIYSLVVPAETSLNGESAGQADLDVLLRYNGQKIVMQAALNTILGVTGIIVETQRTFNGVAAVMYNEDEELETAQVWQEGYETMITINESEETNNANILIKIPVGIYTADLDAEADYYVNILKATGTTHEIITY